MDYKKIFRVLLMLVMVMPIAACTDDDDDDNEFPEIDRGPVTVDAFQIITTDFNTQQKDTFGYSYLAKSGNQIDTLFWLTSPNSLRKYDAEIEYFYKGSNVTSLVKANETRYITCYRNFNTNDLKMNARSTDSQGNVSGLSSEWSVDNNPTTTGIGVIKITLNYNIQPKTNLCDSGVRTFEAVMPYKQLR